MAISCNLRVLVQSELICTYLLAFHNISIPGIRPYRFHALAQFIARIIPIVALPLHSFGNHVESVSHLLDELQPKRIAMLDAFDDSGG